MPPAMMLTTEKLPAIRSAIRTAIAAEIPGSRIVRPAGLEPDDVAADREREEVEHRGQHDLAAAQLDVLGAGDALELIAKDQPQHQAGDQIEHDHHDHADADPLPVQPA